MGTGALHPRGDGNEIRLFRDLASSDTPSSAAPRTGEISSSPDGEHPLTRRTSWVFAVGVDGRVVAEGHGSRLAEVARAIGAGREHGIALWVSANG